MKRIIKHIRKSILGLFLLGMLFPQLSIAQTFPEVPNPPRIVNDFVGILSPEENMTLENRLVAFNDSTSTQIAVIVVDDLQGLEPWEYATKIGEKWGVGQAGKENGIVILIKPTGGKGQKKVFIAPGKGLEGIIPDATALQIVNNEMLPRFKQNDFFGGITAAVDILQGLALQDFAAADYDKKVKANTTPVGKFAFLFIILLFFIFIIPAFKANSYAKTNNIAFWAAFFLLMNSGRSSGSYNHFSNGTGGFGGWGGGSGGGGGFGGFGGGSFGGGGAGGSW